MSTAENKKHLDIVLVNLDRINKVGIFTLAAYSRQRGLSVKIIDGGEREVLEQFQELNQRCQILAAGFTATTDIINRVKKLAAEFKKNSPETFLILGGYHGTILPEETLLNSDFDLVVVREGEITLAEALLKLKAGIFPTQELGCYEKVAGRPVFNGQRPILENLDDLPFPAYDLVNIKKYFHGLRRSNDAQRVMLLLISRGCPFDCVFCGSKQMWQRRFRLHSVDYVVKLIKWLMAKYRIDGISFLDDELLTNQAYINELCDRFIAEGIAQKIKWSCHSRVTSVNLDILKKLKAAGCVLIRFGIESGSEKVLAYLKNKTVTPAQAYQALAWCRQAQMPAFGSFIIGSPEETVEDVAQTIEFIEKSGLSFAEVFALVPYPGTDIYNFARERGLIKSEAVWDDFMIEGSNSRAMLKNNYFDFQQIDYLRSYINLNVIYPLNNHLPVKRLNHRQEIAKILSGDLSRTEFSWRGRLTLALNSWRCRFSKAVSHPGLLLRYLNRKIIRLIRGHWPIMVIVALAFGLRICGVAYGLPGTFVGDEKSLVGGALKMIYEKNIFPVLAPDDFRLLYYPAFIPWIYLIFFIPWLLLVYFTGDFQSLVAVKDYFTVNPEDFFLIARLINVIFSSATIYLVYLAAKKLFSKNVGLCAALIYSVSWLAVEQGHFSKHWNIGGFFAWLSLYFIFSALKNPSKKNYLLAGLAIGLAGFADYVYALFGLMLLLSHWLSAVDFKDFKKKIFDSKFWRATLLATFIFLLGILVYPQEFQRLFLGEDSTATAAKSLVGFWQVIKEVFFTLFYLETVMLFLGIVGGLFLFFKDKKLFILLLFIPLLCPFLYYFFLHFEPRYVLLFLPLVGILAGFGLDSIINFLKLKNKFLVSLICLLVIFWPLKNVVVFDKILLQTDTRILAKNWVTGHLAPGSKIITNSFEFNLIRNQECIYQQQQIKNLSLRSRDYVMWSRPFPDSYCVWPLDLIQVLPQNFSEYQYYIIDEHTARRFAYLGDALQSHLELVQKFDGSAIAVGENFPNQFISQSLRQRRAGPTVWIYKLNFNLK
jgi:radical SAM superfamily enzyme YgiQ (UPF0313 family)